MNDLRKAAQQALDALEKHAMQRTFAGGVYIANAAIALRAALAEPQPFQPDWANYRQGLQDGLTEAREQQVSEPLTPVCEAASKTAALEVSGSTPEPAFDSWAESILGNNPNWRESGDGELARQAWKAGQLYAHPPAHPQRQPADRCATARHSEAIFEAREGWALGVCPSCGAASRHLRRTEMTALHKAAQQALEALEIASRNGSDGLKRYEIKELDDTIAELRAALAQPEQLVVGGDDLPTLTKWTPRRKPLRTVIYACPICAASLERQE